jgi:hypothetical protein
LLDVLFSGREIAIYGKRFPLLTSSEIKKHKIHLQGRNSYRLAAQTRCSTKIESRLIITIRALEQDGAPRNSAHFDLGDGHQRAPARLNFLR